MNRIATIAAAIASLAIAARVEAAPTELRYGLWAKPGEAQYLGVEKFKEVLESDSNGAIKVSIFGGDMLGTEPEQAEQLALNTTQMFSSGWGGLKQIDYLALPYLMDSLKNYLAVLQGPVGQKWNEQLISQFKLRIIGFLDRSPREISANKVIKSLDDLKGLKLRVPELDYYVRSFAAFGAKPTPMAFGEVYTSLQAGTVDGQENPIETIWAMKFYEVQKSVAMVDYIRKPGYVMVGEPFWQSLSEEQRAMLLKAQRACEAVVAEVLPKQQLELIEKMKAAGIAITYPDKKPFIEATQDVRDELGRKAWGDALYKEIVEIGRRGG